MSLQPASPRAGPSHTRLLPRLSSALSPACREPRVQPHPDLPLCRFPAHPAAPPSGDRRHRPRRLLPLPPYLPRRARLPPLPAGLALPPPPDPGSGQPGCLSDLLPPSFPLIFPITLFLKRRPGRGAPWHKAACKQRRRWVPAPQALGDWTPDLSTPSWMVTTVLLRPSLTRRSCPTSLHGTIWPLTCMCHSTGGSGGRAQMGVPLGSGSVADPHWYSDESPHRLRKEDMVATAAARGRRAGPAHGRGSGHRSPREGGA